jgi:transcriptional regulator with GAF, ATPase, and Fis domain
MRGSKGGQVGRTHRRRRARILAMTQPPASDEQLRAALSSVARAIADSLELKEVWGRVAGACRAVVPFDAMGVSLLVPGDRVRVLVAAGDAAALDLQERVFSRDAFSPRLWPRVPSFLVVIRDAPHELDEAFAVDRDLVARGFRSILRLPLGGEAPLGSLILVSRQEARFDENHGRALTAVAELVALALAHEKLAGGWRERRRRQRALAQLVPALAGALDVRAVFDEIARIAQQIVPHDYFTLGLLSGDRSSVRIHATYGGSEDVPREVEMPIPEEERHVPDWEYYLARDHVLLEDGRVRAYLVHADASRPAVVDRKLDDAWRRVYVDLGVRSTLRAPVRLDGVVVGGIDFSSRKPDVYGADDAEFAIRVADHVALALAHHRLAEESRRASAAQDRAARLEERVQVLARELLTLSPHRALGRSKKWKDALAQATKVAPTDTTVLLTGESGTGKEVVARFIHRGSARKDGPFVALNCAALPEQLLESELFGHEKGAFTGALQTRPGRIEQASGGVLFLDEVGEMPPIVQAKLLRVLQEREYQRLGGARTLRADVRVLAATNRDLKAAISKGTFREDLFYRLAVFDIELPPLRERPEDVLVLVDAFLEEIGRHMGRPAAGVSQEARDRLVAYSWPGNVRELRNAIERAMILCEGGLITSEHLPMGIVAAGAVSPVVAVAPGAGAAPGAGTLDAAEREMIVQALARAGQNKSKAARLLGLTRAQLRSRIEKHGIVSGD